MNDRYHSMSLECYSRRLPPGYQIVLRFTRSDYTAALLDPDGTQISSDGTQQFAGLCEIAQQDAKRRASE